jgi:hypothetical protein
MKPGRNRNTKQEALMAKLHELLAVEGQLRGQAAKTRGDLMATFKNKRARTASLDRARARTHHRAPAVQFRG